MALRLARCGGRLPSTFDDGRLIAALNDPALRALINAEGDAARAHEIETLLVGRARAVVERVLARYTTQPRVLQAQDLEDIASTVSLRLMQRLRVVPMSVDDAIVSFDDYVAIVTLNAARDVVRHRHPERGRLEKRLRYVLGRDPRFALWQTPAGILCGLAQWNESETFAKHLPDGVPAGDLSAAALLRLFEAAGAPLRLDALIDAAVERALPHASDASPLELLADERPNQQVELESRQLVSILWSEVLELPPRQRTALLLNLRIAGMNALALFPLTGVASLTDLSAAMGLSVSELADIWTRLPLDDHSIAAMMHSTRQQIINLRKSARERLRRRMNRRT